jgi:hypothetical protein
VWTSTRASNGGECAGERMDDGRAAASEPRRKPSASTPAFAVYRLGQHPSSGRSASSRATPEATASTPTAWQTACGGASCSGMPTAASRSRRGFTSRSAAVTARRKLTEAIDRRELQPARETFRIVLDQATRREAALPLGQRHAGFPNARRQATPAHVSRVEVSLERLSAVCPETKPVWKHEVLRSVGSARAGNRCEAVTPPASGTRRELSAAARRAPGSKPRSHPQAAP